MWFPEPVGFAAADLAALVTEVTGADLHVSLAPQAEWHDAEAQADADRRLAALKDQYDGEASSVDDPELADVAELLSRPPRACYGWFGDGSRHLSALAAGSSWFGLIAIRDGGEVWVRTFRRQRLSAVLADVLPHEHARSTAQPITVLRSELIEARDTGVARDSAVRRAERVIARPPLVSAELYAEQRDRSGRRRSEVPLRVYDTDTGRWALQISKHYDDERWDLAPVTASRVADLLDGSLDDRTS
ncbi:ESX secretion-associated protein EspG [Amycolatopsis sp. FU40]|uniref:ESX secretion-associated protein EspG n=1 Tax=Amycolatopsis sp. FU40 TaxID=2914159 RepID=UPI001F47881B|nr:ESX secretion-associated protein EspG [Amycolatopsis sp. FU40]UKD51098.1 ESX secretion-associated protein EspG [Amycolatopsis sp. FU40]